VVSTGVPGLRSARERLVQTLAFEAGGLLLVTPLAALALGTGGGESLALLVALSVAVMAWAALFNTLFDLAELRWARRVASDRPPRWRIAHAVALETSAALVTWPLIVALTGLGWSAALLADLGLTLAYALWAYVFHRLYDAWRPVGGQADGAAALNRPGPVPGSCA
jgi:uncharacterized membrane protein